MEAEKLFLAYPSSLYIIQYFACNQFNLVGMLVLHSGVDSGSAYLVNIQMPLTERACEYLL